jgi:protein-tyrosine phosphatase
LCAPATFAGRIAVSSAGTGDWHVGEQADRRTLAALSKRGFNGSLHRAKQFDPAWFNVLDLVVALDHGQLRILTTWASNETDQAKVRLLLGFDAQPGIVGDVPDPYYSDAAAFDSVLLTIERACRTLYAQLEPAIRYGEIPR